MHAKLKRRNLTGSLATPHLPNDAAKTDHHPTDGLDRARAGRFAFPVPGRARAEDFIDWGREPILPSNLSFDPDPGANSRPNRIRLFRITPGFLSDPVGLSDVDDPLSSAASDPNPTPTADATTDWLTVTMGNDNPFFDLRRPGDPGGVGYYKVHGQVQLLDSPNTGCTVALQAVTPAGRENNGVDDGPTVLSPQFSLFQSLDDGTAIQGFVGKHVNCNPRWTSQLDQAVQYGMALQRPVVTSRPDRGGSVYVFVEALGRYHYDTTTAATPLSALDVLPGLQWQLGPNWWMSGGLVVPMTSTDRIESNQWQITCSFQF